MSDLFVYFGEKIGIGNTIILFVWLCFFISFAGVLISYRNFTENCVIGKAVVSGYVDNKVDEAATVYVKLLDLEHSESYCTRFTGSADEFAIGTEVEVAYKKTGTGYDIRLAQNQGKNTVILMFILQLIPFIVLVAFNILSK